MQSEKCRYRGGSSFLHERDNPGSFMRNDNIENSEQVLVDGKI